MAKLASRPRAMAGWAVGLPTIDREWQGTRPGAREPDPARSDEAVGKPGRRGPAIGALRHCAAERTDRIHCVRFVAMQAQGTTARSRG